MNWIQRYVEAARAYFPTDQRDDLSDELNAQLQDQLDALEANAGRPATDEEIEALLCAFGHPMHYASKFHPRQALIAQPLLETYKLVLRYICWVLVGIFSAYALLHAISHDTVRPLNILLFVASNTLEHFVWFFTAVTAVFYFAETPLQQAVNKERWQPRQLPHIRPHWSLRSRGESAFSFVIYLIVAGIVFGGFPALETFTLHFPSAASLQLISILTPIIGSLLLMHAFVHLYHCLHPYWNSISITANFVLNIAWLVVIGLLLTLPDADLPQLVSNQVKSEHITKFLNQALTSIFLVIGLVTVYELVRDGRRLGHLRRSA